MKPRIAVVLAVAVCAAELRAQCPEWSPKFHDGGFDGRVNAMEAHDFGQGARLVLGGEFNFAAGEPCENVAVWDGQQLAQVGDGLNGAVEDLQVFQGELYAAGWFDFGPLTGGRVARFDGVSWQPVGAGFNDLVRSLAVHQGSLYVAGRFTSDANGDPSVSRVARFDGANWVQVGAGISGSGWINEIESFDFGGGAQLWALGSPAFGTQRFDGSNWTDLTPGSSPEGWALATFDTGSGPQLYGGFNDGILRLWNGAVWVAAPGGPTTLSMRDLAVHDDGSGAELYAVGLQPSPSGVPGGRYLSRWDGANWSAVGSGLGASSSCSSLASFDDGSGHGMELWVGGAFDAMHEIAAGGIAAWNGSQWRTASPGDALSRSAVASASGFAVETLASWTPPGAARPLLFAAGDFDSAGGSPIDGLAAYDGVAWSTLGSGVAGGRVGVMLGAADLGSASSSLYVGGDFQSAGGVTTGGLARWDGANWHDVGGGTDGWVEALHRTDAAVFGTPSLFVAGYFVTAGGVNANSIARFDGAQWHALGSGGAQLNTSHGWVTSLVEYDDPSTPEGLELFAGGSFNSMGGVATILCARWDGASWREAGTGLSSLGSLRDLELFDDGSGTKLFAVSVSGALLVRASGAWTQVAAPIGSDDPKLVVHDGGAGERLYRGRFVWNGLAWTPFASLMAGPDIITSAVSAVDPFNARAALWLGGEFEGLDGVPARNIARWSDPCAVLATYCTAKINSQGCTPAIGWSGEPALSQLATTPFEINATNIVNQKNGVLFYSPSGRRAAPFQGGVLCVAAPLRRTPFRSSNGSPTGADCTGVLSLDFSPWLTGVNDPMLEIGLVVDAQWWYRDPASPSTTGLSNALELEIAP